jgi:shikimate dehydrogenase
MINNEKFKAVGIIGKPLNQSLSPYLHNYWINKYKLSSYYLPLPIDNVNYLKEAIKKLNFLGLNITIPYKKSIFDQLDIVDTNAKKIGAVNTLIFSDNKLKGFNTDIIGFKKGLIKKKWNRKRPVIIIGAGGAAEAIIYFLKLEKIKDITVVNRTKKRAKEIKKKYKSIKLSSDFKLDTKEAGLIINTSSLGMVGYPKLNIKLNKINKEAIIYDIVYNPIETHLIREAKKQKLEYVTGLDMFIEQARASFEIWFQIKPDTNISLIKNIKKKISKT